MKIILLIFTLLLLLVSNTDPVLAKTATFSIQENKYDLQISSGKTLNEFVTVKNLTHEKLTLKVAWKPYTLIEHSIDFAALSQNTLELEPNETGTIEVAFETPAALKPGDYYGYLQLTSGKEISELNFRLRFLGELKEEVQLTDFKYSDQKIKMQIKNNGNITTTLQINLVITNFFGQKVSSQNIDQFDIKAGDISDIELVANTKIPGPYQAKLETTFGSKKTVQSSVRSFWIDPFLFWAAIFLLPILLIVSTLLFRRQRHV